MPPFAFVGEGARSQRDLFPEIENGYGLRLGGATVSGVLSEAGDCAFTARGGAFSRFTGYFNEGMINGSILPRHGPGSR